MENKPNDLSCGVKTKHELVEKLEDHIAKTESKINEYSISRVKYLDLTKKLLEKVKKDFFPEPLADGWELLAEINDKEAFVFLQLVRFDEEMKKKDEYYEYTILQLYKLEEVNFG